MFRTLILLLPALAFSVDEEAALLAAINANRAEDTPRLVYADWLQEHEQEARAELIRVQVELARLSQTDSKRATLSQRAKKLLETHRREWLPRDIVEKIGIHAVQWERGFPVTVALSESKLEEPGVLEAIGELQLLSRLELNYWYKWGSSRRGTYLARLAQHKPIQSLPSLYLVGFPAPELTQVLNQMPSVRDLYVSTESLRTEELAAIAASPSAKALRSLRLTGIGATGMSLAPILDGRRLPELRHLQLDLSVGAGEPGVLEQLSEARHPPPVRSLDLGFKEPNHTAWADFAKSPLFLGLRHLKALPEGYFSPLSIAMAVGALSKNPHHLLELNLNSATTWDGEIGRALAENRKLEPQGVCAELTLLLSEMPSGGY